MSHEAKFFVFVVVFAVVSCVSKSKSLNESLKCSKKGFQVLGGSHILPLIYHS